MTIIAMDGFVSIDGNAQQGIDMSSLPPNTHAVQWYDDRGEIEFSEVFEPASGSEPTRTVKPDNQLITDLEPFQSIIDAHAAAVAAGIPAPPTLAELKAQKWGQIEAERDRRKTGGVLVGTHWFHSDDSSRIQQLGLVMFGVSVPPVPWKTMTGEFVPMTQDLANQIFPAVASADQAIFAKAEEHKAAMEASADPANYDFSAGWPPVFGQ